MSEVVEIVQQANLWSAIGAFFTFLTPLAIVCSTLLQKKWADRAVQATVKVKDTLVVANKDALKKLESIQDTTIQTHILVNSQKGVILKNMALLSRNHAVMARKAAFLSDLREDYEIAERAEIAASEAESVYELHQSQQDLANRVI